MVMLFHKCGATTRDDANIPIPKWIMEIGKDNLDIYFIDREGRLHIGHTILL